MSHSAQSMPLIAETVMPRRPDAGCRMARVAVDDADPHLDRAEPALRDIAEQLLADCLGAGPAARGVDRQFFDTAAAEQPPHRHAQ